MKSKNHTITNQCTEQPPETYQLLLASLLFLMTRFSRRPDHTVATGIIDRLDRLARNPQPGTDLIIKNCERLIQQWSEIAMRQSLQDDPGSLPYPVRTGSSLH